jgi:hypothetical protein
MRELRVTTLLDQGAHQSYERTRCPRKSKEYRRVVRLGAAGPKKAFFSTSTTVSKLAIEPGEAGRASSIRTYVVMIFRSRLHGLGKRNNACEGSDSLKKAGKGSRTFLDLYTHPKRELSRSESIRTHVVMIFRTPPLHF